MIVLRVPVFLSYTYMKTQTDFIFLYVHLRVLLFGLLQVAYYIQPSSIVFYYIYAPCSLCLHARYTRLLYVYICFVLLSLVKRLRTLYMAEREFERISEN